MRYETFNLHNSSEEIEKARLEKIKKTNSEDNTHDTGNFKNTENTEKTEVIDKSKRLFIKRLGAAAIGVGLGSVIGKNIFSADDNNGEKAIVERSVNNNKPEIEKKEITNQEIKHIEAKVLKEKKGSIEEICQIDISKKTKFNAGEIRKYYEKYYQSEEGKKEIAESLNRMKSTANIDELKEIFRQEGVDEKYIYLSIVESNWHEKHNEDENSNGALGYWQFLKRTGREYGLKIEDEIDERKDPEKSARACAKFLKDLHREYKEWNLALSKYNGGYPGKYKKQVEESGEKNLSFDEYLNFMENKFDKIKKEIRDNGKLAKHKVKENENIKEISEKYDLSIKDIMKLNPEIKDYKKLKTGQRIKLPDNKEVKNIICKDIFERYDIKEAVLYAIKAEKAIEKAIDSMEDRG